MDIETIIQKGADVANKRDKRRVEVSQAAEAAATSLRESTESNAAILSEQQAITDFQTAAASYTPDGDIDALLALGQRVFESRGKRLIEVDQAAQAIAVAIQEQAESDAANFDEDAAISELKELANNYTKE